MSEYRIIVTGGRKRESEDDYATLEDILDRVDPHGFVDNRAAIIQGGGARTGPISLRERPPRGTASAWRPTRLTSTPTPMMP